MTAPLVDMPRSMQRRTFFASRSISATLGLLCAVLSWAHCSDPPR